MAQFISGTVVEDRLTILIKYRCNVMSMRGEIISKEYQSMVFVNDNDGKEYACYARDVGNRAPGDKLTDQQKAKCMDLNHVLGDTW